MKREYEDLFKQYCVPEMLFVISQEGEMASLALEISLQVSDGLIRKVADLLYIRRILISTGGTAGCVRRFRINPDHETDVHEALEDYQRIKKFRFVLRDQNPKRKKSIRVAGKVGSGSFRIK